MKKSALSTKSDSAKGKSVIAEHGGKVKRTFTAALNGYSAKMSEDEAKKLAADPAVDKVFANQKHKATGEQADPLLGPGPHRHPRAEARQEVHLPRQRG